VPATPAEISRRPTIRFSADSGRATGSGGCNSYGGTATITGQSMRISRVISTKRACIDPSTNAQESRFFVALESVDRFHISADTLQLYRGSGVALRFAR
jgi:heat shock protein HslJ